MNIKSVKQFMSPKTKCTNHTFYFTCEIPAFFEILNVSQNYGFYRLFLNKNFRILVWSNKKPD